MRLISKRRQCSAEARDPILVITLPPPSPPRDSRRSCCVRLFEHQFLGARVLVTSRCLSLQWPCTNRPLSEVVATLLNHIFFFFFPPTYFSTSMEVGFDFQQQLARPSVSQHSSLVQCVWPCAPRRVSLSDKYNQGHPLAPAPRPVGAWQSPHNNSVLMVLLSQGWGELRASLCGLKEPLARGPGLRG